MPWKETTMINERTKFALLSLQPGVNFCALCQQYGISRKTGYKWKARFLTDGITGLVDQSRRPINSPQKTDEGTLCEIVRLHEAHLTWGPTKIRELYARSYGSAPSESSFKRIFDRCGWVKKRKRKRSRDAGRIHSGYRAEEPNDVWSVDFKGWWYTNDGDRCEPLTIRDEFSRYILEVRVLNDATTESVKRAFEGVFKLHGLPKCIRSDNGSPFAARSAVMGLSRLSAWWMVLGINLERGRPGKPQDNGAHERMHRDIRDELECHAEDDIQKQQAAFDIWRNTFNQERPHEALSMKTPAEVYSNSPRTYEGTPADIHYEGMQSRRVQTTGMIGFNGSQIMISRALSGWSVGLKASGDDTFDVYFAGLRLGKIDSITSSFSEVACLGRPEESKSETSFCQMKRKGGQG